jgi:iron complex transport system permease protein
MSALTHRRLFTVLAECILGCAVIIIICPLIGMDDGLRVLGLGAITGGDELDSLVYFRDRLPRTLAAAVVGGGLAGAGCAFQSALRNPLAEPYTLGVSSGASLAAVVAITFGAGTSFVGESAVAVAALFGAAATVLVVWRLARVSSSHPPATLLLAGITIAMLTSAASLLVQYTASYAEVYRIVRWMMGSLDWIRYSSLLKSGVLIAIGLAVLLAQSRDLNALAAGSEAAASVGVNADRALRTALVAAALVVGAGIAIAGPIGFIGLMVPHALRAIVGPDHRVLLPASILVGGAALVVCDTVARTVIAPAQLPVGVVTALLGGPFFLYLLVGEKSRSRLWGG